MKPLRILALMHANLVPPDDVSAFDVTEVEWKMEFDVAETLRSMSHEVLQLGVEDDLGVIRKTITEWKPHIVFNLIESFHGVGVFDQNVVSFLELMRVPYTGCNPRGLMLARDKALSKTLLISHRIAVPDFMVVRMGRKVRRPKRLIFPLIVKSLTQEASIGISRASVVEDDAKLVERVRFIHESIGTDAIIERFIDGREMYVGIVGNQRLEVFPIWELRWDKLPDDGRLIMTDRAKWSTNYQKKYGVMTNAAELSETERQRIHHLCKRAYRSLDLSGYARLDLRMDAEGRIYVLEANPNPQLAYGEDFAESAEHGGVSYEQLLQKIINYGLSWRPERAG
ncbi:MAG: ATP-grasp domain-containing protein [Vicinamibacterales bacterium]